MCVCVWECFHLEFICIIEANLHGRNHPGLEQGAQDLMGHCICDKVKVQRVPPTKGKKYHRAMSGMK